MNFRDLLCAQIRHVSQACHRENRGRRNRHRRPGQCQGSRCAYLVEQLVAVAGICCAFLGYRKTAHGRFAPVPKHWGGRPAAEPGSAFFPIRGGSWRRRAAHTHGGTSGRRKGFAAALMWQEGWHPAVASRPEVRRCRFISARAMLNQPPAGSWRASAAVGNTPARALP